MEDLRENNEREIDEVGKDLGSKCEKEDDMKLGGCWGIYNDVECVDILTALI